MDKMGIIVIILIVIILGFGLISFKEEVKPVEQQATPTPSPTPTIPAPINYQQYNIDYMNDNIKSILERQLGVDGKTTFYLPSTGYINVSKGTKYGVAFALNNPNPSGENRFEYSYTADSSVVEGCNVSIETAQSWIERGWGSSGKIPRGWVDAMTIYFAFPKNIQSPCNVRYNFIIEKDGILYDSKQLEFNLI